MLDSLAFSILHPGLNVGVFTFGLGHWEHYVSFIREVVIQLSQQDNT